MKMKQSNEVVESAMVVFSGIPPDYDGTTEVLDFLGMYKSKYVSSRVYKYKMEKKRQETISSFEKRFREEVVGNRKLRKEIKRYRELRGSASLQLEISLGGFAGKRGSLVDSWTFSDQIAVLAKAGRSMAFKFCNSAKGREVCVDIPATFVKLLAKCRFSFRLSIK